MRDGRWPFVPAALAATLLSAAAFAGEEALKLFGKVKTVEKDGSAFDLQDKRGTFRVILAEDANIVALKPVRLETCAPDSTVHVLGQKQEPVPDPQSGHTLPAQIIQIVAIVAADGFKPPPIPEEFAARKLEWMTGRLKKTRSAYALDGIDMQVGRDRTAVAISASSRDAIAKGKLVFVEGAREGGAKARQVRATRAAILAPEIPLAQYRVVLGL